MSIEKYIITLKKNDKRILLVVCIFILLFIAIILKTILFKSKSPSELIIGKWELKLENSELYEGYKEKGFRLFYEFFDDGTLKINDEYSNSSADNKEYIVLQGYTLIIIDIFGRVEEFLWDTFEKNESFTWNVSKNKLVIYNDYNYEFVRVK